MRITQHRTNGVFLEFNNGLKLSTFLPVVDLGKKYNPIIKKY